MTLLQNGLALLIASILLPPALALHASDVGVVDWHTPLVGVPLVFSQALVPVFHRVTTAPTLESSKPPTQSVVLTATSSNVLAALEPVKGEVAWRYLYEPGDPIVAFKPKADVVVSLSGPGGATLRTLDVLKGDLIVEQRLHKPEEGVLFEPVDVGVHIAFAPGGDAVDAYVLTNGHVLRRVNVLTGQVKWEWAAEDMTSSVVFSKIAVTPDAVYVVGLTKSTASYTLHIEALGAASGEHLATVDVPSSIHNGLLDFLVLSDSAAATTAPRVAWIEKGAIRSVALTPGLFAKPAALKGVAYVALLGLGLSERGQFVALKKDGTARVMRMDEDGASISQAWDFKDFVDRERYSSSLFTGGLDKAGRPYVARIFWSHVLNVATAQIFSAHSAEGTGLVRGFTFPFETNKHGIIAHAALDVANPSENVVIARFMLTTGTGALQLWQQDRPQWTRAEALAETKLVEFVELPERKAVTTLAGEENETFGERLVRQVAEAKDFPSYLLNYVRRFATGSYTSVSSSAAAPVSNATSGSVLYRDEFGFRKVIVAATPRGIVFGLNSADGAVLWSRILGLGAAAEAGGRHVPVKLFTTRTVSDGERPQVVLVTQRVTEEGRVDTVVFHIDALTGNEVYGKSEDKDLLLGEDVVQGELVEAFLVPDEQKTIALVDRYLQIHLYPNTSEAAQSFRALLPKIHFPLPAEGRLVGHRARLGRGRTDAFEAYAIWTTRFGAPSVGAGADGEPGVGEEIVNTFVRGVEPVAALGKVLADRRTLYKHLAPGLVGVVTRTRVPRAEEGLSPAPTPMCGVYLVDGVKGSILYHAVVDAPSGTPGGCTGLRTALTENWFVYVYYQADTAEGGAKGHRIVSVELYEGGGVDDKTRRSETTAYHNRSSEVTIYEQTYALLHGVSALATTSTKYGIAVKDLIIANDRGQVLSLPRRILDPRRPKRKPTPQEQQEEWLVQYDPVVPLDPRRILSHNYRLGRIHSIHTSPALLESTSLIFAHGLGLFGSRIAPSGTFDVLSEEFNKLQLVLTIAALAVAILITRPIVRRKKLRERWY